MIRSEYDDRVEFTDGPMKVVIQKNENFAANIVMYIDQTTGDPRLPAPSATWQDMDTMIVERGRLL